MLVGFEHGGQFVQCAQLVLRQCFGGEQIQCARLWRFENRFQDRDVIAQCLTRRGAGRDDDILPAPRGVDGERLMRKEFFNLLGIQSVLQRGMQWFFEARKLCRTRADVFQMDDLVGVVGIGLEGGEKLNWGHLILDF